MEIAALQWVMKLTVETFGVGDKLI